LLEHDLFRKPVTTFRDHALAELVRERTPSIPTEVSNDNASVSPSDQVDQSPDTPPHLIF
jgi:hypothetical protein